MTQYTRAEEESANRIVYEYGDSILRLCLLYLHDEQLAQDAAQDSLIKICGKLSQFQGKSSEKTWIMHIVANTCRDYYRSSWYRHIDADVMFDKLEIPDDIVEEERKQWEKDCEVTRAVANLPRSLREVILLRFYQNMSINEISQALRCSVSAVNKRLRKAKEKLKPALWGVYFDE